MRALVSVLADAANATADGKLNILGEFNLLWASGVPVIHPRMFLVLKLDADPGEGTEHKIRIRVLNDDGQVVGVRIEGQLKFGHRLITGVPASGHFIFEIQDARFDTFGGYEFEVTVGETTVARIPLFVAPMEKRA